MLVVSLSLKRKSPPPKADAPPAQKRTCEIETLRRLLPLVPRDFSPQPTSSTSLNHKRSPSLQRAPPTISPGDICRLLCSYQPQRLRCSFLPSRYGTPPSFCRNHNACVVRSYCAWFPTNTVSCRNHNACVVHFSFTALPMLRALL